VIVEASLHSEFVEQLVAAARSIAVGDGADETMRMGPVCGRKQYEGVLKYIETGKSEGARLVTGGVALTDGSLSRGFYIAPTVFANVNPTMTIAREEIFGPVISVLKAQDFDDAVRLANDTCYGLASSIYTNDHARAQQFLVESEVGLCHVNLPTAHKEPQLEFGGIKESGRGLPEAGEAGIEFFTRHKAVYVKERP
jgi:aldehyde dehydrogenase (NAD+)